MPSPLISTAALADRLHDPALVIVDTRHDLMKPDFGRQAYASGHIPGALFLSIDDDLSAAKTGKNGRHPLPSVEAFAHTLGGRGIDRDATVVVYDQGSAMFVGRLWWMLRWMGHEAVYVLDGGFAQWEKEMRPIDTEVRARAPREYVPAPREAMRIGMQGVRDAIANPKQRIIDARAPERYRGEIEPIDPVAGHIPGAINRPFPANLSDGKFKSPSTLRAEFDALLAGRAPEDIVHQCGSGVSALANMIAMEHAGLSGSKLYAGSWSEWCAHPENPVARA